MYISDEVLDHEGCIYSCHSLQGQFMITFSFSVLMLAHFMASDRITLIFDDSYAPALLAWCWYEIVLHKCHVPLIFRILQLKLLA